MVTLFGELLSGEGTDTRHALAGVAFMALAACVALMVFRPGSARGVASGESFAGWFLK